MNKRSFIGFVLAFILMGFSLTVDAQNKITLKVKGFNFTLKLTTVDGAQPQVTGASKNGDTYTAVDGATVTFIGDIKTFNLTAGRISSLDVSHAPNLQTLNLSNQGTDLQTLDLTQARKLEELTIGETNLNSLILPNPSALKELNAERGGAVQVDFSAQVHLEHINSSGGRFVNVEITNSPKLKEINLHRSSSLKSVRINNAPELITLFLGGSRLEALSVKNAPKLKNAYKRGNGVFGLYVNGTGNQLSVLPEFTLENTGLTSFSKKRFPGFSGFTKLNFEGEDLHLLDLVGLDNLQEVKVNKDAVRDIQVSASQLSNAAIQDLLNNLAQLPAGQTGSLKIFGESSANQTLVNEFKAKAEAKGWNVSATTPVEEIHGKKLAIYPTNTTGLVNVEGANASQAVQVYSTNGVLAQRATTDVAGNASLSLGNLPKGSYIVVVGATKQQVVLR